ncbi:MAG: hypothetical protein BJ554DRAFT_4856, partial [Olpidium bornovanus]
VTFYCRTFLITGCDVFTRNFLSKIGVWVPPNMECPSDPYTLCRSELMSRMKPTRPNTQPKAALKKFLENDRRIREQIPPNSGRDNVTNFLRRCRLPKHPKFKPIGGKPEGPDEYYTDRDLTIGSVLHLYGRSFVICDCDTFTKEYYYHKYGIESFEPLTFQQPVQIVSTSPHAGPASARPPAAAAAAGGNSNIPPYNGFGSEEDSLGSCIALIPKPPRKDFKKLMRHDGNAALRFSASLNTAKQ